MRNSQNCSVHGYFSPSFYLFSFGVFPPLPQSIFFDFGVVSPFFPWEPFILFLARSYLFNFFFWSSWRDISPFLLLLLFVFVGSPFFLFPSILNRVEVLGTICPITLTPTPHHIFFDMGMQMDRVCQLFSQWEWSYVLVSCAYRRLNFFGDNLMPLFH